MESIHGRPARLVTLLKVMECCIVKLENICGYVCTVDVLDSVIVKCGCLSMVELLVGEIESSIKQSPYLPLTDDDDTDVNFITDDPLLDKNFNECHSKKEDKGDTSDLVVDGEQDSSTTLSGTQMKGKELMFQLGIFKYIFWIFKTRLTKDRWTEYPTEQHALVWCLRSLKVIIRNSDNY